MNETKSALTSTGVWGGVIALVASVASIAQGAGVDVDPTSSAEVATQILGAVGGVLAIWGRIRATKKVGGL